ncbi:hypothetical protein [Microbacterium dauci]|uniref:Uncharacterized protein n=1 Tax=Microbacterium dauci TaxID=3048008 RepID=A0ABT6ZEB5_9MICO|nr:hypothetical protein [Microbacterium sp. LX3-4]MDJ1114502.1 hypothetical protein [Microbacterium sp. LX3-4]
MPGKRRYREGPEPWWLRDYGGVRGWMLIPLGILLIGVVATVAVLAVTR